MFFLLGLPRMAVNFLIWFLIWMFTRPGGWLFGCVAIVLLVKVLPPELWQMTHSAP